MCLWYIFKKKTLVICCFATGNMLIMCCDNYCLWLEKVTWNQSPDCISCCICTLTASAWRPGTPGGCSHKHRQSSSPWQWNAPTSTALHPATYCGSFRSAIHGLAPTLEVTLNLFGLFSWANTPCRCSLTWKTSYWYQNNDTQGCWSQREEPHLPFHHSGLHMRH